MFRILLFFTIIFLITLPLFAQSVDTAWVRRYNGPGDGADEANDIITDSYGNVYVTGRGWSITAADYTTIKYSPNGDTAWIRIYNGPSNGDDISYAIVTDGSGNVFITGVSPGSGTGEDYTTIKYYPNGDTAWVRRYNGPGFLGDYSDRAYSIALDDSNNVYVTGNSMSETDRDYATVKYDSDGDTLWVRRYNGPIDGYDTPYGIATDGSGNVYVTGESEGIGTSRDIATIKYYANGDTAWVRRYNGIGNGSDHGRAIVVDDSGNVYVTGDSEADYVTIKYLPNGDTAWVRKYNGPGNGPDLASSLALDDSSNVYVTGYSLGSLTSNDYATIKYYPNGDTAWVRRYNGPGNFDDVAYDIAVNSFGEVYVTGRSASVATSYDFATIKYFSNGDFDWEKRYDGPKNNVDIAVAICLDNSNNVYVTGVSEDSVTANDFATIKYILQEQRDDTLIFTAYSPVDLIVTDPNLDSIGVDFNTITEATYDTTQDINEDGENDDVVTIPKPLIGEYMVRVVAEPGSEGGSYTLSVKLDGNEDTPVVNNMSAPGPSEVDTFYYPVFEYLRGDANTDGLTSVSDVIFLINYLFKGGDPPEPLLLGDANCCKEGEGNCEEVNITVSDVIYLINYLFKGGDAPCS